LIGLASFLSLAALILAFLSGKGEPRMASAPQKPAATDPREEASDTATVTEMAAAAAEYQYDTLVGEDTEVEKEEEKVVSPSTGISIKTAPGPMEDPSGDKPEGLFSPASGLGWESYMQERLDAEISRSASFEQDLSLLVLSYDGLSTHDTNYPAIGAAIKEFFNFRDLSFERGDDGFSVILPNIDSSHALRMAEEFYRKLAFIADGDVAELDLLPLFMGISSRSGRLVGADRMVEEAAAALEKARYEKDTRIIAFRPDPDKYRRFLASKGA